ncbi:MAG: hypothetical protein HY823_14140 [Acidobacteria bacterium]|nr:hypothetical protein [Acidobacteriota bacterium]
MGWRSWSAWGLTLVLLPAVWLRGEETTIEVNPNRPTFANPALTTQPGLAELEWGLQQARFRDASKAFQTPTLLKLGLAPDLELRLSGNGFLRQSGPEGPSVAGWGDVGLAAQWCYLHDGFLGFDQALQVSHKFPTASVAKGLGSGTADDALALLFSRDVGDCHADVNLLETWLGRGTGNPGGRVRQPAATLAVTRNLGPVWSITGEVYGMAGTVLNPRVVSNLWALACKVSHRLVLDCGVDAGLTRGAQRYSLFAGLTVGLARFPRPLAH